MCTQWRLAFEEPAAMFSTFGYFFRSVSPRVFLLENDQWNHPRDFLENWLSDIDYITLYVGLKKWSQRVAQPYQVYVTIEKLFQGFF